MEELTKEAKAMTFIIEELEKLDIAIIALTQIKNEEGRVCDNFALCHHRACKSSYSSWHIANEALKKIGE